MSSERTVRRSFRLEPQIELAQNYGLSQRQLNTARHLIGEHEDDIPRSLASAFRKLK